MKKFSFVVAFFATLTTLAFSGVALAGVPFNNLEGVGGVAFNPLAYLAGAAPEGAGTTALFSKAQFGVWHVNLNDSDVDWTTIGLAGNFSKRVELSYGYESVAVAVAPENIHKNNVGAKLLLLDENAFGSKVVPAVAIGAIYKHTTLDGSDDNSGVDYYLVASKLITQLPRPLLISAGALSTQGRVTGILGFDDDRKITGFANIDLLPLDNLAIGFEYKQGAEFDTFKNADYWNAHIGWLVNKNLSLIAAYADAGDRFASDKVGLGGGTVVSAQYQF